MYSDALASFALINSFITFTDFANFVGANPPSRMYLLSDEVAFIRTLVDPFKLDGTLHWTTRSLGQQPRQRNHSDFAQIP